MCQRDVAFNTNTGARAFGVPLSIYISIFFDETGTHRMVNWCFDLFIFALNDSHGDTENSLYVDDVIKIYNVKAVDSYCFTIVN